MHALSTQNLKHAPVRWPPWRMTLDPRGDHAALGGLSELWAACEGLSYNTLHIIHNAQKDHEFDDPMGGFAGLLCEARSALEAISVDDAPNDVDLPKISNMKHKCMRDGMAT